MAENIPNRIRLSTQEQAEVLFFSHYVHGRARTFDYLPALANSDNPGYFAESIAAVSLALLFTQAQSPEILVQARQKYIRALRSINSAIQDYTLAIKDSTLLSILLLSFYEKLTNTSTAESWLNHMTGATALIKLRGQSQFQSPIGLRMSGQLSSMIAVRSMQAVVPVPPILHQLREVCSHASQDLDKEIIRVKFLDLMMQYAELQVAIKADSISNTQVILTAEDIDAGLVRFSEQIPKRWQNNAIIVSSLPQFFFPGGRPNVHSGYLETYASNCCRLLRLLLSEIIWRHSLAAVEGCTIPPDIWTEKTCKSKNLTVRLCNDICASVQEYTTTVSRVRPSIERQEQGNKDLEASRYYMFVFPMYIAGQCSLCPPPLRKWIIDKLNFIADHVGIKESKIAAERLERGKKENPWSLDMNMGAHSASAWV